MRLLLRRALVIDPRSPHHGKRLDLLVRRGKIEAIGRNLNDSADHELKSANLCVSPGWLDIGAQSGEPGLEHREDLSTLARAALAGGYTGVVCFPNTAPPIDSKSSVEYILNRSKALPIHIYPIGTISEHCRGTDLAELRDMHAAGALAFSDGRNPVTNTGLLQRALEYTRSFNGLVIDRPYDASLSPDGQMHESAVNVRLGLMGIPSHAEVSIIDRNLHLLTYSRSRLHLYALSAAGSIPLIRKARRSGLDVSASVAAINLLLDDSALEDFDTNLKVMPPLRSNGDRSALVRGLRDGVIDCIVSNHEPVEEERKKMEFDYAGFGATGLETAFAVAHTALHSQVALERIIHCLCHGPRELTGVPVPEIRKNAEAELTLFDPDTVWTVSPEDLKSRSANCPVLGRQLTGRVLGVVAKGALHRNFQ